MNQEEPRLKRKQIVRKGRLSGAQRNRLRRLLNMMYTTIELAKEIDISPRIVREVYIPLGCPYTRNRQNHIMINGIAFRDWYQEVYKKRTLASNEAFCISCKQEVIMVKTSPMEINGLSYLLSECPVCGRSLSKIISMDRKKDDK
jgi:hypothetical protein